MSGNVTPECEQSKCNISGIDILPDEIISYILEFLPFTYLQDARLVCQRWYNASQSPSLLNQEEVICLQSEGHLPHQSLLKSKRLYWNFCLKGDVHRNNSHEKIFWSDWFQLYDETFWTYFGPEVRSLSFHKCEIVKESFLTILSHCRELRSLEIKECRLQISAWQSTDRCSLMLPHLETLSIDDTPGEYYDEEGLLFDTLLSGVTRLKSLLLVNCMNESGIFGTTFLTPKHVTHYVQQNTGSIVNISFIHKVHNNEMALTDLLKLPNLKLQSLETNYPVPKEFATSLKSLRVLKLRSITHGASIEMIFSELQLLKSLQIDYYNNATLSDLHLLRNLSSLELGVYLARTRDPNSMILQALCSEENRTLRKLSLRLYGSTILEAQTVAAIAKTHPALTDFEFDWNNVESWDLAIQSIFKYQVSLRTLRLTYLSSLTNAGLNGEIEFLPDLGDDTARYSLSRLKNLWKLDLDDAWDKDISFENLILPELRELSLSNFCQLPEDLESFLKNHPKIERLLFHRIRCREETVDVIVRLPRLKYVYMEPLDTISEESISKLRQRCKTDFGPCSVPVLKRIQTPFYFKAESSCSET